MSRIISVCDAEPIVEALSSDDSEDLSAMDYLSDSSDFSNFSDSSGSDSSSNSEETSLTDEHKKAVQGMINEFCENLKAYFGEQPTKIDYALRNYILRSTRQAEENAFKELSQKKQSQQ